MSVINDEMRHSAESSLMPGNVALANPADGECVTTHFVIAFSGSNDPKCGTYHACHEQPVETGTHGRPYEIVVDGLGNQRCRCDVQDAGSR